MICKSADTMLSYITQLAYTIDLYGLLPWANTMPLDIHLLANMRYHRGINYNLSANMIPPMSIGLHVQMVRQPKQCVCFIAVVMNIRYFSYFYFLSLYLLDKEIQRDTYLNPCSKFILNFLDLFTLKSLHFANDCSYLNLNLCLSDYALFSNHDRGYADLSKCLWLCMSKHVGVFNHLFLYRFLLKYIYKYIKL